MTMLISIARLRNGEGIASTLLGAGNRWWSGIGSAGPRIRSFERGSFMAYVRRSPVVVRLVADPDQQRPEPLLDVRLVDLIQVFAPAFGRATPQM
jgi:hypothetical protein